MDFSWASIQLIFGIIIIILGFVVLFGLLKATKTIGIWPRILLGIAFVIIGMFVGQLWGYIIGPEGLIHWTYGG